MVTRATRYDVRIFLGSDYETPLGCTLNLSASGVLVETDLRPTLDEVTRLTLVWGDDTFACSARVVRHTEAGVAFAFVDPDDAFRYAISDIISELE